MDFNYGNHNECLIPVICILHRYFTWYSPLLHNMTYSISGMSMPVCQRGINK
jgi:hypothetical protein